MTSYSLRSEEGGRPSLKEASGDYLLANRNQRGQLSGHSKMKLLQIFERQLRRPYSVRGLVND